MFVFLPIVCLCFDLQFYPYASGAGHFRSPRTYNIVYVENGEEKATTFSNEGIGLFYRLNKGDTKVLTSNLAENIHLNYGIFHQDGFEFKISSEKYVSSGYMKIQIDVTNNNMQDIDIDMSVYQRFKTSPSELIASPLQDYQGMNIISKSSKTSYIFLLQNADEVSDVDFMNYDDGEISSDYNDYDLWFNKTERAYLISEDMLFSFGWSDRTVKRFQTKRFTYIFGIESIAQSSPQSKSIFGNQNLFEKISQVKSQGQYLPSKGNAIIDAKPHKFVTLSDSLQIYNESIKEDPYNPNNLQIGFNISSPPVQNLYCAVKLNTDPITSKRIHKKDDQDMYINISFEKPIASNRTEFIYTIDIMNRDNPASKITKTVSIWLNRSQFKIIAESVEINSFNTSQLYLSYFNSGPAICGEIIAIITCSPPLVKGIIDNYTKSSEQEKLNRYIFDKPDVSEATELIFTINNTAPGEGTIIKTTRITLTPTPKPSPNPSPEPTPDPTPAPSFTPSPRRTNLPAPIPRLPPNTVVFTNMSGIVKESIVVINGTGQIKVPTVIEYITVVDGVESTIAVNSYTYFIVSGFVVPKENAENDKKPSWWIYIAAGVGCFVVIVVIVVIVYIMAKRGNEEEEESMEFIQENAHFDTNIAGTTTVTSENPIFDHTAGESVDDGDDPFRKDFDSDASDSGQKSLNESSESTAEKLQITDIPQLDNQKALVDIPIDDVDDDNIP